jgi:hypothetical protein
MQPLKGRPCGNLISPLSFKFSAGGPWLITDMERMESIFELEPSLQVSENNIAFISGYINLFGGGEDWVW